jgi:hypothetical protein
MLCLPSTVTYHDRNMDLYAHASWMTTKVSGRLDPSSIDAPLPPELVTRCGCLHELMSEVKPTEVH